MARVSKAQKTRSSAGLSQKPEERFQARGQNEGRRKVRSCQHPELSERGLESQEMQEDPEKGAFSDSILTPLIALPGPSNQDPVVTDLAEMPQRLTS